MQRLLSFFVPRSWVQSIMVFAVFELMILGYDVVVQSFLDTPRLPLSNELLLVFGISAPFVIFVIALLRHQARLQDQLRELARTDALTELPNRRSFFRMAADVGDLTGAAVLMIDVDHFKQLNDTYGHAHGDQCLQALAERMRDIATPDWIMGRLGGEEFAVLIPDCPLGEACQIAKTLTVWFEKASPAHKPLSMTASVGVAAGLSGLSVSDVMSRADEALYAAKAAGRACAVKWSDSVPALPNGTDQASTEGGARNIVPLGGRTFEMV